MAERIVETQAWRISVPERLREDAPLLVVPTVHPRGDRRILSCAVAALEAGYRIHFVWLGEGERSTDPLVAETLLATPSGRTERIRLVSQVVNMATALRGDAWHIHDFYLLGAASRWRRKTGRPVMFDSHEYYGRYYAQELPVPASLRPTVERIVDGYEVRKVRALGFANLVAQQMSAKYEGSGVDVTVTPNFPLAAPYASAGWAPFSPRRWRVVHTGMLSTDYGTELLTELAVRAEQRGLPFRFDVVKRFASPSLERQFRELLAQRGNPANLRLIDPMPAHAVAGFLAGAGFGLSLNESTGQYDMAIPAKSYEYLLSGLVGVITNLAAQRAFWREHGCSVVSESNDADELLDGMLARAQDPMSTDQALAEHRQLGLDSLTWDRACVPSLAQAFVRMRERVGSVTERRVSA